MRNNEEQLRFCKRATPERGNKRKGCRERNEWLEGKKKLLKNVK